MAESESAAATGGRPKPGAQTLGRGWLIASGILAIVAGVIAIVVPAAVSAVAAIFFGWFLIVASIAVGISAFGAGSLVRVVGRLLLALLILVAGLYLVVAPQRGALTLTVLLAILFIAIGLVRIVAGIVGRHTPGAGLTIVNGAVSLVLGLLIFAGLPSSAAWAIGLLVGIDFVVYGLCELGAAAQLDVGREPADRSRKPAPNSARSPEGG